MSKAIEQEVKNLVKVLQGGDVRGAKRGARILAAKRIPRKSLVSFSQVVRRLSLPELALRPLNRIVRPSDRRSSRATDRERAEYAALLGKLGAYTEAIGLLEEISPAKLPVSLLHLALISFARWDWESAIPLLNRLIEMKGTLDYDRTAGRLRLAAAFVHGTHEFESAEPLLEELRAETRDTPGMRFLHRDVLLIRAQLAILAGQPRLGLERLEELRREYLTSDFEYGGYIVRMWRALAELKDEALAPDAFVEEMNRVHDAFARHGWWELARTCEYYKAIHTSNEILIERLYFGSPHLGLRRRLARLLEGRREIPGSYLWHLARGGRGQGVLDVRTGRNTVNSCYLKPDQLPQRVIEALASDFYRPIRITELFELLYPGEYFNPWSSPVKVRQAIKRARRWISSSKLPVGIEELNSYYRFRSEAPFAIRVYDRASVGAVVPMRGDLVEDVGRLAEKFGGRPFSVSEASKALGVSLRSALRVLTESVSSGLAERRGKSSATRYTLKSEAGSKALSFDPAS